jgi:phenylacetate-CoA ligase
VSVDRPTDADRYPTLSPAGRRLLVAMREHPSAPIYRNESGNRLTADDVAGVRAFESEVLAAPIDHDAVSQPPWLPAFIARCYAEVPFYRRQGSPPADLTDVPPVSRADLAADVAAFVPDSAALDRLINFRTSGTTGHALLIPSHPVVAASYLAFHKRALRRFGVTLRAGAGEVGLVLIGMQRRCFTYVSVTPTQGESGLAKINLHPDDWRRADDRAVYLDALAPEVIAGDPISFAELAALPLRHRPRALLSTSMALAASLRERLAERFGCPVLDLYSLNEAGPVGVFDAEAGGHVLLQHRLVVEILDGAGRPLPPGQRGEVTLTGGFNACLPLLRYRTGDFAALAFHRGEPTLADLAGRPPVRFRTTAGEWLNNIEVTFALRAFAIPQYALHQDARGGLRLRLARRSPDAAAIAAAVRRLFGADQALAVEEDVAFEAKVVQYTSDLAGAEPAA